MPLIMDPRGAQQSIKSYASLNSDLSTAGGAHINMGGGSIDIILNPGPAKGVALEGLKKAIFS